MRTTLALLCLFCVSQIHAYPLPSHPVKSYECDSCDSLSHDTLQDRWEIAQNPILKALPSAQKSFSYNRRVTAQQLEKGVLLPLHAQGAVLQITPLQNKPMPALELKGTSGSFMPLEEASSLYSQNESMDKSLRKGSYHTLLQIKPELGLGNFIIKSTKSDPVNNPNVYLIHVFEKNSSIYLQIEPTMMHYQYGDEFNATITLKDNKISYPVDEISASLVGPNQEFIPLKIKEKNPHQFQASTTLLSEENTHGDNWYIEVDTLSSLEENGLVYRTGRAAFSYSIPSASLTNIRKISSKPLRFVATLEVATASRYALNGILFKKNAKEENIPIELTQTAQWLNTGEQTIHFGFDNSPYLAQDNLALGYLRLTDYGQMKTVYHYDVPIKLSQILD